MVYWSTSLSWNSIGKTFSAGMVLDNPSQLEWYCWSTSLSWNGTGQPVPAGMVWSTSLSWNGINQPAQAELVLSSTNLSWTTFTNQAPWNSTVHQSQLELYW
jgi:hypothetical protein